MKEATKQIIEGLQKPTWTVGYSDFDKEVVTRKSFLLCLFWSPSTGRTIRKGEISAHIETDTGQPTPEEMSSMLYAAKMEFARMRRKKRV